MLTLHPYQGAAQTFWLQNPLAYFAVDMGLGKTAIVLHTLVQLRKPALIIAPIKPMYNTWPAEIELWNLPLTHTIIHGQKTALNLELQRDVYLANYESLHIVYDHVLELAKNKLPMPFDVLVIDEGSMIKNPDTRRFDYLEAMRNMFTHVAILSGTPAPNCLGDLWSQYRILDKGESLGLRHGTFKRKYFDFDQYNPYDKWLKPGAKEEIFKAIAPKTFRLDAKDYLDLPEIIYNDTPLVLPPKVKKLYDKLKRDFILEMEDTTVTAMNAASLSMKLRQLLQGFVYGNDGQGNFVATELHKVKIKALKDLIEETNQPILCALQFRQELNMILEEFPETPVIHGDTKTDEANQYIEKWNAGEIPLLLCHPASLSHGVNLQSGGNIVVWFCLTWSLEQYLQFNGRLHRQGQKHGVVVHHLVMQNTIDEKVGSVLRRKDATQSELLSFLRDENNY